jgi:hypothetical protein
LSSTFLEDEPSGHVELLTSPHTRLPPFWRYFERCLSFAFLYVICVTAVAKWRDFPPFSWNRFHLVLKFFNISGCQVAWMGLSAFTVYLLRFGSLVHHVQTVGNALGPCASSGNYMFCNYNHELFQLALICHYFILMLFLYEIEWDWSHHFFNEIMQLIHLHLFRVICGVMNTEGSSFMSPGPEGFRMTVSSRRFHAICWWLVVTRTDRRTRQSWRTRALLLHFMQKISVASPFRTSHVPCLVIHIRVAWPVHLGYSVSGIEICRNRAHCTRKWTFCVSFNGILWHFG